MSKPTKYISPFRVANNLTKGLTIGPDFLIENLLERGDQMLIYGKPKVGKTFFAIQLACSLVLKEPFLGWEILAPRKVLYVNFEMGERAFATRIAKNLGIKPLGDLADSNQLKDWIARCNKRLNGNFVFTTAPRSINVLEDGEHVRRLIRRYKPDVVVFDTLAKLHDVDESGNKAIQTVLTQIRNLCELKGKPLAHIIVHHARKGNVDPERGPQRISASEIRGGSAIAGEADVIAGLGWDSGGKGGGSTLRLALEARNVKVDDLHLNFNEDQFFTVAKNSDEIANDLLAMAKKFIKKSKAPVRKADLEADLARQLDCEPKTLAPELNSLLKGVGSRIFKVFRIKGHKNTRFIKLRLSSPQKIGPIK